MSQNQNDNTGNVTGKASFAVKAGYVGPRILIGLVIYPFLRKTFVVVQPKLDKLIDDLTGKAEGFAEKASELMSAAMDSPFKKDVGEKHDHSNH
jgi:hypothetical protein